MINCVNFSKIAYSHNVTEKNDRNDFSNHQHATYEVLFILKGSGTFLIENNCYEFTDNTIFLIPPGKYHVLQAPPQKEYERFIINFAPEFLPSSVSADQSLYLIVDDNIRSMFLRFDNYADTYSDEPLYALLLSFLTELLIVLTYGSARENARRMDLPEIVKNAVDYITQNLEKPLEIDTIAQNLFVSKSYLSHIFTQTMNISVMRYIRIKKMYAARGYLQRGYSAVQVAQMVGYDTYSTFLRNYQAEFSVNPSAEKVVRHRS